ncbi:hypothetical protein AgCh_024986 [Apium graveolens]
MIRKKILSAANVSKAKIPPWYSRMQEKSSHRYTRSQVTPPRSILGRKKVEKLALVKSKEMICSWLDWNIRKGEVNGFYYKASSDKSLAMALEALTLEHHLKELFYEKGLVRGLPHLEFRRMKYDNQKSKLDDNGIVMRDKAKLDARLLSGSSIQQKASVTRLENIKTYLTPDAHSNLELDSSRCVQEHSWLVSQKRKSMQNSSWTLQ